MPVLLTCNAFAMQQKQRHAPHVRCCRFHLLWGVNATATAVINYATTNLVGSSLGRASTCLNLSEPRLKSLMALPFLVGCVLNKAAFRTHAHVVLLRRCLCEKSRGNCRKASKQSLLLGLLKMNRPSKWCLQATDRWDGALNLFLSQNARSITARCTVTTKSAVADFYKAAKALSTQH